MERMNRAGRVAQFTKILAQRYKRNNDAWMSTGDVTKRAGLKSSTRFKNMLIEMSETNDNIVRWEENGNTWFKWRPYEQLELPQRYIVINGHSHKVANWVLDEREVNNNA
jgi:hypothetical protein